MVTVLALIAGYVYGGPTALFLVVVLGILEVSLSFDNAIINANILQRMSRFWQRIFLTIGILIAVFGMRLLFPLLIVLITAGLAPVQAFRLALNPPTNGRPTYEDLITGAHHQIAAFGGIFLWMLFLDFVLNDRKLKWLNWIEEPLTRIGRLEQLPAVLACATDVIFLLRRNYCGYEGSYATASRKEPGSRALTWPGSRTTRCWATCTLQRWSVSTAALIGCVCPDLTLRRASLPCWAAMTPATGDWPRLAHVGRHGAATAGQPLCWTPNG